MIEPRCDDGTEPMDEECGFIVAGGVIAFGFETGAELLSIGFYIVKHPSEVLGGVAQLGGSRIVREHFQDSVFDLRFHIRFSFHQLVGKAHDFGSELLSLALNNDIIHWIGKRCKDTANQTDGNADQHCHILV